MAPSQTAPLFEVSDLTPSPGQPSWSFALNQGEVLGIYGPSGGGKSVLLKKLADLLTHDGCVALNGRAQNDWSPQAWRARVMLFAAETAWWLDTVGEHFRQEIDQAWLKMALEALQLSEAMLKQPVAQLSSGEKQRLALIRGIQYSPRVLLLDEVTANLDPHATAAVEGWLSQYLTEHGACAIWVSHDAEQLKRVASCQRQL
ncbi:ABC transporter [Thiomicrospira sp. WB1]|nr:ABC transporter [Thiomicrospira sp. WB1]